MTAMEFGYCTDKGKWDAFVRASPHGNIFCQSRFLDALVDEYELAVVEEDGNITVGAVVMLRDGTPMSAPYHFTMYQGALCGAQIEQMPYHRRSRWQLERMEFLINAMAGRRARISLCLSHRFDDVRAFQWFNYHEPARGTFAVSVGYTGLLSLEGIADFESFLSQVRTVRRQEYRHGLELGLTIEPSTDIELLNKLHAATFMRQGIARDPADEQLFVKITAAAVSEGFGELLVCRLGSGEPASATLFLHDDRYAYYHVGANDPEYRKTGAGTFLLAENIRRALSRGALAVDFIGINSPSRGDFKTSFNARPVPYYTVDYTRGAS